MNKFKFLILTICCISILETASAKTTLKLKCGYVIDMMKYSMQGMHPEIMVFSLKKDTETNIMVFTSTVDHSKKMNDKGLYAPWRILVRQEDTSQYCLVGAGERIEALASAEYANPKNKYGMPGSGYPRCSTGNDLSSALDVDLWANKELGKSLIFQLNADLGNRNFRLLMSPEQEWVLTDSNINNVKEVCYYSRGSNAVAHSNFKMAE